MRRFQLSQCGRLESPMAVVPVMAVPVAAPAPMATMPAPMAMVPAPMAVPMMSPPVMPPPHFFRLEAIDLLAGGHGGMGVFIGGRVGGRPSAPRKRLRQKRRGLCAGSQGGGSGGKSKGEFQKIPAFHDIYSFA